MREGGTSEREGLDLFLLPSPLHWPFSHTYPQKNYSIFFSYRIFKVQCLFYTNGTSQFGLGTFQVLTDMWLLATILNSRTLRKLLVSCRIFLLRFHPKGNK